MPLLAVVARADEMFSCCIRERADHHCEFCGKPFRHEPGALQCSHLEAGRRYAIRWAPIAAACHCWECHRYLEEHPHTMEAWAQAYLGEAKYLALQRMRHSNLKLSKPQIDDIYRNLKASHEAMRMERDAGADGRIEFPSPYPAEVDFPMEVV